MTVMNNFDLLLDFNGSCTVVQCSGAHHWRSASHPSTRLQPLWPPVGHPSVALDATIGIFQHRCNKKNNVCVTIINHPFGNGIYQLSMVIRGMVYYCYTHIMKKYKLTQPGYTWVLAKLAWESLESQLSFSIPSLATSRPCHRSAHDQTCP